MIATPLLTELDLETSSEGGIDPLGLAAIAESLSVKLCPGVRERQYHPRFLTAMAISSSLCSDFEDERIAKDGISPPWQVFEWYVVEGLVRGDKKALDLRGLPGRDKAQSALDKGLHLSAKSYLKTPGIFGFHGIYRVLARDLGIEQAGGLGESGHELLQTWAREQGLEGFHGSAEGPGKEVRNQLIEALIKGLEDGAVARSWGWSGWAFFQEHLPHRRIGTVEAGVLTKTLRNPTSGHRMPLFDFLVSAKGQQVWRESESERAIHEHLLKVVDGELRDLLLAVLAYEGFARTLHNAFDECLKELTLASAKTPMTRLAKLESVIRASREIPELFAQAQELLGPFGESTPFAASFGLLAERLPASDWTQRLLDHHVTVQGNKPPDGKSPWFEPCDDGSVFLRTRYHRTDGAKPEGDYVHGYRGFPLWSFATDLHLVKDE